MTAGVFHGIGAHFDTLKNAAIEAGKAGLSTLQSAAKVVAHGLVGGAANAAAGGKFLSGFISAGFVQGLEQVGGFEALGLNAAVTNANDVVKNAVASAVIGGTAAVLGGGKFKNGALTGAFSRLFNDLAHSKPSPNIDRGTTIGRDKLEGLEPEFRAQAEQVIDILNEGGWNLRIVHGRRTQAENQLLVEQEFASPTSKHLSGQALDFVERNIGYDNINHPMYNQAVERAASQAGVIWGGHFTRLWDPNHIESIDEK